MGWFSKKITLDEEQLAELQNQVLQDFKEQIGAQILKKYPEAFNKKFREAIAEEAEKWAPRYCKETQEKMEREINRWKLDQPFMKRLANLEREMEELKADLLDFRTTAQSMIERMAEQVNQLTHGQRPQPNAALQELHDMISNLDQRLTHLEITGKRNS